MNKLPCLLLIIIVFACNPTKIEVKNEPIECCFCWGIDDSLDNEQSQNSYCAPKRQITMCFKLINTSDSTAFVPLYTFMDSTFKSHITIHIDDRKVSSICKSRKKDNKCLIAPGDSMRIEIVLLERHLVEAGIISMPIKDFVSKIKFDYVIDSLDIINTRKNISEIKFSTIDHKLFLT